MDQVIGSAIFGILLTALGIMNMRGNISSIHWYHRKRVAEKDKRAFGKAVGSGTLLIGLSLIFFGMSSYIAEATGRELFTEIGAVAVVISVVLGLTVSIYGMMKYNKGLF